MALTICTWLWGDKYSLDDVTKLSAGLDRHIECSYSFAVCAPVAEDELLTNIPGCFARLRMFDPAWQREMKAKDGDRLVCIDLDVVVTGALDPLFDRDEPFVILQGANSANPCPYNGSLWMLRAGYRPDVWTEFSLAAAEKVKHAEFPDDQSWLAHKLPGAAGWQAGSTSGVYAFKKPGWPEGDDLPNDARLVAFPGWRSPAKFMRLKWVQDNWTTI